MNVFLIASALLGLFAAVAHIYLGERFVLGPMFEAREGNRVLSNATMRRLLRWVWHLPSFAWAVVAAATLWFGLGRPAEPAFLVAIGVGVYATGALANLWAMRGPHVGNIVLALAAITLWLGAS